MKLSRTIGVASGFLVLLCSCAALAQSDPDAGGIESIDALGYPGKGAYLQGNVISARRSRDGLPADQIAFDNSVGFDLAVGGRFSKFFAGEISYEGIPKILGPATSSHAFMVDGKAYFPIGRFQPFFIAGIGGLYRQDGTGDSTDLVYRLGGGLELFLTRQFYLTASYRYTGNLDDFGYLNFLWGVGWHLY